MVWVIGSLTLAAVISPWLYQGGKLLAAMAASQDLPAFVEWLGAACCRSKFGRYFDRALLVSAMALLPLLLGRIRRLRVVPGIALVDSKSRVSGKSALVQVASGFVIASGLLLCMGTLLMMAGVYVPEEKTPGLGRFFSKIIVPAVTVSLMEEWLFRGVLLGLWLRSTRKTVACIGTSLLFAFLHFLKPPAGTVIADPSSAFAGFELLGKILLHFTEPLFFVTDFASLLLVGLILAWARIRTGALWFSIGLHSGWIMAFKGFNLFYENVPRHPLMPWGVGESLRSGIFPLFTLAITAVVCHFALRRLPSARPTCQIARLAP